MLWVVSFLLHWFTWQCKERLSSDRDGQANWLEGPLVFRRIMQGATFIRTLWHKGCRCELLFLVTQVSSCYIWCLKAHTVILSYIAKISGYTSVISKFFAKNSVSNSYNQNCKSTGFRKEIHIGTTEKGKQRCTWGNSTTTRVVDQHVLGRMS